MGFLASWRFLGMTISFFGNEKGGAFLSTADIAIN